VRVAHIINPVILKGSDLTVAQPLTFESMRIAAEYAAPAVDVELISTQFPEDREIVPAFFTVAPDLERSALDVGSFAVPRKLPLIGDILDRMREAAPDADTYIYTNVDIGLVPHFYSTVAALMQDHDALVINRRTIPAEPNTVDDLPLIYAAVGERHPGYDGFVVSSELFRKIELGRILIGVPWIGTALLANLACHAERLSVLRDAHLTFHLGDDRAWRRPELEDYRTHNRREMSALADSWLAHGLIAGRPIVERIVNQLRIDEAGGPAFPQRTRAFRMLRRGVRSLRWRLARARAATR